MGGAVSRTLETEVDLDFEANIYSNFESQSLTDIRAESAPAPTQRIESVCKHTVGRTFGSQCQWFFWEYIW